MATLDKMSLQEEKDCDEMVNHPHQLLVNFHNRKEEWKHRREKTRTELQVFKLIMNVMLNCPHNQIIIQLGKADKENIVSTHFFCPRVPPDESLTVLSQSNVVETPEELKTTIKSRDKYTFFYTIKTGGVNTKTKKVFRNTYAKDLKYLSVYGEKGWTVEEALKRDGRFIDDLGNFSLSEDENANYKIQYAENVDHLEGKIFKSCLPLERTVNHKKKQKNQGPSKISQNSCGTKAVFIATNQRGISVRTAAENSGSSHDTEEIYKFKNQQFLFLKQFPDSSYQEKLNLRKENFGKIQKLFNEVHRVRKLLEMGESVCKVVVENVCVGTGFVLFDNLILTNAHLFEGCVEGERLKEGIKVDIQFNYEDPEPHTNYYYFKVVQSYICYTDDKDYAILEVNREDQILYEPTTPKHIPPLPPGLLKHFGPVPESGEACLIGHPAGEVKKIDYTYIIEKENREQVVNDYIYPYKDHLFTAMSITHLLRKQGIEQILKGGSKEDTTVTYNTFMYHGSSGSPVFDADGRVFGLHTRGYTYGFPQGTESVIEYAQPLLTIFEDFVRMLRDRRLETLLKRVKEEAEGNSYLEKVLISVDEPAEPMEIP